MFFDKSTDILLDLIIEFKDLQVYLLRFCQVFTNCKEVKACGKFYCFDSVKLLNIYLFVKLIKINLVFE